MRSFTNAFAVNGVPMLAPDGEVEVHYEDLDSAGAGRDQTGVMHRLPVRYKLGVWSFRYAHLTEEEKRYMEGLFPEAGTFSFTHPGRLDAETSETTTCYRSKYAITWRNAATGLWSGYSFQIIQC